MGMSRKHLILFIFVLILAIAAGFGYAKIIRPRGGETGQNGRQTTGEPGSNAVDTSAWKTYRNEELGFEFNYPENWNLSEMEEGNEIASVSNYFTNKFSQRDGSQIRFIAEQNKYNSFKEWQEQNFKVFENETVQENQNIDFQGLSANLVKSVSPIAGGHNDRLAIWNQQKNVVFVIWTHRRIRVEQINENKEHEEVINKIVDSFKINQ